MKTAIVIGATSGIGREVASLLVRDGYRVGICGRRTGALACFQDEFGKDKVFYRTMDITTQESVPILQDLLKEAGRVDLFLHVSGVGNQNRDLDLDKEIRAIRTNCEGMVRIVDTFINHVKSNGEVYTRESAAHIAVVTSVAGTMGMGTAPAYSSTKKMQSTYLTALAQLCRMREIPVIFSDIRPGFVRTDILSKDKHYPMMMTVSEAARHIIKGLKKKKRVIIFDYRYRIVVFLWRLIPRCLWERISFVKS